MSYFEGQLPWPQQEHLRQASWDQGQPQNNSMSMPLQDDMAAFAAQFEEIDRASDNLARTGKTFGPGPRRDMPMMAGGGRFSRQFNDFERPQHSHRHGSIGDYDGMRSHSAHSSTSAQGYYAAQRYGPRGNEADQMMQVKRRAAAQRERELRNYHQEQQYNRNVTTAKPETPMSPSASAMSEEDRRVLIARQHRALYGDGSNLYVPDGAPPRPLSQDARVMSAAGSGHGSSPMAFDAFSPPTGSSTEGPSTGPTSTGNQQRSPDNVTSKSPNPGPNAFTMFDNQQNNNSGASGDESSASAHGVPGGVSVGPIGSRSAQNGSQQKRNSPPSSSPLNFGFSNDAERSASAASNPQGTDKPVGLGWGSNNGGWSNNKHPLSVQASVWG